MNYIKKKNTYTHTHTHKNNNKQSRNENNYALQSKSVWFGFRNTFYAAYDEVVYISFKRMLDFGTLDNYFSNQYHTDEIRTVSN